MSKIYLITNNTANLFHTVRELENQGHCCLWAQGGDDIIFSQIKEFAPELILVDVKFQNAEFIVKKIKGDFSDLNIQIILLIEKNMEIGYLNFAQGYVVEPIEQNILIHTINSHLKIKNSLDALDKNNKEVSKNLYQLNVLYNTSSQFAGTLNREKLCNIMLEGLEKTLSFDVATLLVFNKDNNANIYLNSLHQPTESLKEALILRLLLEYKGMHNKNELPYEINSDDVKLIQNVKQSRSIFDLRIFNFDKISAPIKVGDDFFGVIEIYRQNHFTSEDLTCFQTIANQVPLPLRSAKLYEEIIEKNVQLEKLEKMKSEFVSIVSHELRTPLTPINNSLEIILSGAAGVITPEIQNFVNMAKRNVSRLSVIIEDLLDLSRVQTGKLDFKFKEIEITPALELAKETFEQSAGEKEIELSLHIAKNLPKIYGDAQRIEQILSNLISNALKFTPNGGKIELSATEVEASEIDFEKLILPQTKFIGKYIKICTKDTGIGLEENDIIKIFDKFSQIENTLARNVGGVGLGLSITKQLIDAHFGGILVESKKNEGSNFCFFLPVLSEPVKFQLDVYCQTQNGENFGLIYLEENLNCGFLQGLKEKNAFKLTKNSKVLTINSENKSHNWFFTPESKKNAIDFIEKTIQSEIEKNAKQWENCGILVKKVDLKNNLEDLIKTYNLINKIWEFNNGK